LYSPEGAICLALPTPKRLKIANFSHPLSFSAFVLAFEVTFFEFMEKLRTVSEARVFQAADNDDLMILARTIFD